MSEFDRNTYRSSGYLAEAETLYLLDGDDEEWLEKFRESYDPLANRRTGPSTVVDARAILHEMRLIKDEEDIRYLRRVGRDVGPGPHPRHAGRRARPVGVRSAGSARRLLHAQRLAADGLSRRSPARARTPASSTTTRATAR